MSCIRLSWLLPVVKCMFKSLYLSVCLSIDLSVCLSTRYLSVCLSVSLYTCVSMYYFYATQMKVLYFSAVLSFANIFCLIFELTERLLPKIY